jgi:uncharacterized coiled-coil protein SlyX
VEGEIVMTDPKPSLRLLATRLATQTDNTLGTLGDFKGALESLTARAAEAEGLNQQIADAKAQLATLKAQLDAMWSEFEKMKESYTKLQAEVSVPATKLHEIRTMLRDM